MELAQFIRDSLVEIANGLHDANEAIMAQRASQGRPFEILPVQQTGDARSQIEFDVAVTASSTEATKGGGGLKVAVVSAGLEASREAGEERVSRIKFQVVITTGIS